MSADRISFAIQIADPTQLQPGDQIRLECSAGSVAIQLSDPSRLQPGDRIGIEASPHDR